MLMVFIALVLIWGN